MGNCKSSKKAINSLIYILLWMLFSNVHLKAGKLLVDEIFEASVPCVVQIHSYDKTGELLGRGTGFFIAADEILTCAHVIEDAYSAIVISSIKKYYQIKILKMDEHVDLALLRIHARDEKFLQLENEQKPTRDQYLMAIGYNYKEHENAVSYGLAHAIVNYKGIQEIVNSVSTHSGWSGGPLFNLDGHVVGVHKGGWGGVPKVAFSTSIKTIKEFLERPSNPKDLAYARSSELWSVIVRKLTYFWWEISWWMDYLTYEIRWFLFLNGILRGIYIITLIGMLIGWRTLFLLRFIRSQKRRKAVNKINKWSGGASSLEMEPVLETKGKKRKYRVFADNEGDEIVVDRNKIEERIKLILRKCRASSGGTEDMKEL